MHRWLFVGLALMAAVGGVGTALVSGNRPKHPTIGLELIAMSEETSGNGFVFRAGGDGSGPRVSIPTPDELANVKSARELDAEHTARLKAIVDKYGWPGKRLVGADGAHAAFVLLQRADQAFKERALALMQQLPKGQVDPLDLAVLTDRVAVAQQRPQVYGTLIGCNRDTGEIEVVGGLVDEAKVDELRAGIGLRPLAEDLPDARYRFGACQIGG